MPLHARPIPAPATVPGGRNDPTRPHVTLALPVEDPPAAAPVAATTVAVPETASPAAAPETASPAPAQVAATPRASRSAPPRPWYRREPWLPVILAAFAPIAAGFVLPPTVHPLLLGASALLVVLGTTMLIRQGLFGARRASGRRSAAA